VIAARKHLYLGLKFVLTYNSGCWSSNRWNLFTYTLAWQIPMYFTPCAWSIVSHPLPSSVLCIVHHSNQQQSNLCKLDIHRHLEGYSCIIRKKGIVQEVDRAYGVW